MAKNLPTILNKNTQYEVDKKVVWGKNVTLGPNCQTIKIGYGCYIGNDIYIDVQDLHIGDYVTIHHGSVLHGVKCTIGHNCWIGQYTILDSLGGLLELGNNVGVGAHSQLWSHMKFGDRLAGCRWYQKKSLRLGDDVWIVGHCIVTPITAAARSMLLVGGVAVDDMIANHIYAGSPAKDVTDKLGQQFRDVDMDEKKKMMKEYIDEYKQNGHALDFIKFVDNFDVELDQNCTYFNLITREYKPRYTDEEYEFMRFLLYDKAKFIPI